MSLTRTKVFVALLLILIVSVALVSFYLGRPPNSSVPDLRRVGLVGDSLTQITSYPSDLQALLGSNSTVGNFGASGTTVVLSSVKPYVFEDAFPQAKRFLPTTVIIMLGTNDARSDVYGGIDNFVDDYELLISKFQALPSKPQIFLVVPPPFFENNLNLSRTDFTSGVIPKIEQVANETGLPLIDTYTPLLDHPEYFVDGVHLNEEGSQAVANIIYRQLMAASTS